MFNESCRGKDKIHDTAPAQTAVNRPIHLEEGTSFPLKLANSGLDYVESVQKDSMWRSMAMPPTQETELVLHLFVD